VDQAKNKYSLISHILVILVNIVLTINLSSQTQLASLNYQYNTFYQFKNPANYWVSSSAIGWTYKNGNKSSHYTFADAKSTGLLGSYVQSHMYEAAKDSILITTSYEYLNIFDERFGIFHSCQITNDQGVLYKYGYQIIQIDTSTSCVWMTLENDLVKYNYKLDRIIEYIAKDNKSIRLVANETHDNLYGVPWENGPGIEIYSNKNGNWSKEKLLTINSKFSDIVFSKQNLYLARKNSILKMNVIKRKTKSILNNKSEIINLSLFNDILFVSSKNDGIIAIDLKTEKPIDIDILKWLNKLYKGFTLNNMHITNDYLILSFEGKPPIALNIKNQIESVPFDQQIASHDNICVDQNHIFALKDGYLTKLDANNETSKKQFCPYLLNSFEKWRIKENNDELAVFSLYNLYIYDKHSLKLKFASNFSNIYFINSSSNGFYITSSTGSFLFENSKIQEIYKNRDYIHIFEFYGLIYAINNQGILVNTANQSTISAIGFVNHILQNEKNVILSSNNGVYKLDKLNVEKMMPNPYHIGIDFFGSAMDDLGNIWVTSSEGLYHIDLRTKLYNKILLEQFNIISRYAPIYFDQKIMVNNENKFTSINSKCYKLFVSKPIMKKQNFILDNKNLTHNQHYTIPHDYKFFQIQSIFSEQYSDSLFTFLYRIPSIDTTWTKTSTSTINFSTLQPGSYSIELKALGTNHLASDITKTKFTIQQPIYQRPWFILSMALIIFALGYYFQKRKVDKILHKKQIELDKLKALQEQRERLARDLHDEIGSGLSKIKFISSLIAEKDDAQSDIQQLSSSLLGNMRDMLWSLDMENDTLHDLIAKIRMSANTQLKLTGIQLIMDISDMDTDLEIAGFVRRNFLMIVKEAIHNVIKHTDASTIWIMIDSSQNQLQITIKDNGQKTTYLETKQDHTGKYGLTSMRRRALDIGATIDFQNLSTGWCINILYPIKST
jgi:signal transduction histidine kinase